MSVTVADVMRLPSMTGAEVIAGAKGLSNLVESVSVLEYGQTTALLNRFFHDTQFEGNEIMLTAFVNILDDVDAQCANIRRYHSVGSVGMVVYYVGIILPEIDQRLIDLCNELDFVLIRMPPGQAGRRYSEVISEVLFEVFREQQKERFFVSALLDRLSGLQPQQRTMETLLRMLSEHLRVSVILTSQADRLDNVVFWPRSIAAICEDKVEGWLKEIKDKSGLQVVLGDGIGQLQRCPMLLPDEDNLQLYLLQYNGLLAEDILWQASELVRLFIHIWNKSHGKFVTSELIRAIINDEPLQKERLAQMFHIQMEELNQMWLFLPRGKTEGYDEQLLHRCTDYLSQISKAVLISYYEENLVAFTNAPQGAAQRLELEQGLTAQLAGVGAQYTILCCDCLNNTAEARQAYLDSIQYCEIARKIYPHNPILRTSDILFAKLCQKTIADREAHQQYSALLARLKASNAELLPTVESYLFDAASNMAQTAKLQFVHINTVKYRLRLVQDLLGYAPGRMPDAYPLYIAAALNRILRE